MYKVRSPPTDKVPRAQLPRTMRESYKPKPKTEAPWAGSDVAVTLTTTHATSYANYGSPQRTQPIRPKPQHDWTSSAFEGRSTHQDSYTGTYLPPRESYKPRREYSPERWEMKLTTTSHSSYLPNYGNTKREACRPKRTPLDMSKFDTRSTAQDAFMGPPPGYRPVAAFYPKEKERENAPFENTTTSRSAYVAWPVCSSATAATAATGEPVAPLMLTNVPLPAHPCDPVRPRLPGRRNLTLRRRSRNRLWERDTWGRPIAIPIHPADFPVEGRHLWTLSADTLVGSREPLPGRCLHLVIWANSVVLTGLCWLHGWIGSWRGRSTVTLIQPPWLGVRRQDLHS